jgi:hypothetical protein
LISDYPHPKNISTLSKVLHFESLGDFIFEELHIGTNYNQVVNMDKHKTWLLGGVVMKETRIDNRGVKIDGGEEVLQSLLPALGRLLEAIKQTLELETVTSRQFDAETVGNFDEQLLLGNPVEECAPNVHLLDIGVLHGRDAKE